MNYSNCSFPYLERLIRLPIFMIVTIYFCGFMRGRMSKNNN